jgi:membrane protein involved in colicin uptake
MSEAGKKKKNNTTAKTIVISLVTIFAIIVILMLGSPLYQYIKNRGRPAPRNNAMNMF